MNLERNEHSYRIDVKVGESVVEVWNSESGTSSSSAGFDGRSFSTQLILQKNEIVQFPIERYSGGHRTNAICKNNGVSVGCSYIQGQLVERI